MPARSQGRTARALLRCVALLAAMPSSASAADTEPIRIAFQAPAGCPDEAAFTGQITARTRKARVAAPGETARTFTVTVTAAGTRTRGKLTIDEAGSPPAVREVSGGSCEEVVSALGLVAALAIDPQASTAPTPPPPPPAPPPPPPPPPPVEHFPPPPRYTDLPWWGPIGMPLPVIPGPEPEPTWRMAWGLRVGGMSAVAPEVVLTLGGFVEVARVGGGVLSPAFRLGAFVADTGFEPYPGQRQARFALGAARVEGCPVRVTFLPSLWAAPCVLFDAGALQASGLARQKSIPNDRPWAAPGASARLQWELFARLLLEVEGGVNFPLVRDTFSFQNPAGLPEEIHGTPAAGGFFAAGVGTHFP